MPATLATAGRRRDQAAIVVKSKTGAPVTAGRSGISSSSPSARSRLAATRGGRQRRYFRPSPMCDRIRHAGTRRHAIEQHSAFGHGLCSGRSINLIEYGSAAAPPAARHLFAAHTAGWSGSRALVWLYVSIFFTTPVSITQSAQLPCRCARPARLVTCSEHDRDVQAYNMPVDASNSIHIYSYRNHRRMSYRSRALWLGAAARYRIVFGRKCDNR